MKGDFTRVRFRPQRHYSGVRMQQGRVQLDADFNEEADIREYVERTEATDVIGLCGVPKHGGGFRIGVLGGATDLTISPGRIYADGILCELEDFSASVTAVDAAADTITLESATLGGRAPSPGDSIELVDDRDKPVTRLVRQAKGPGHRTLVVPDLAADDLDTTQNPRARLVTLYSKQPYWPGPPALTTPDDPRSDLVYLDVWQRHVTAIEDPGLLEEALGGVDTSTRVQTVWQVKVLEDVGALTCEDEIAGWPPPGSGGRMTTDTVPVPEDDGPCVVPPAAGYTGIENRLYRVEVHEGTAAGAPSVKWSRDNGSVAFAVDEFVPNGGAGSSEVRLRRLGRDGLLGLAADDWVEVVDDAAELAGETGVLVQIATVDELQRTVTLRQPVSGYSVARHARLRRWDQGSAALPLDTTQPLQLENGITVDFAGGDFRAGDYWAFAARTATGDIEQLTDAPPQGIRHHYCRLALVHWDKEETSESDTTTICRITTVDDCRDAFPPLTDICAEDVCYDGAACGLTDVDTVQEALDRLCDDYDLAFHKRHLHGWGIVCGLRVQCDECKDVMVTSGYAIDCDGRDIRVPAVVDPDTGEEKPERIHVLERVARLSANGNGATPVAVHTEDVTTTVPDGKYAVVLGLDDELRHTYTVEPFDVKQHGWLSVLKGTLLLDFYECCLRPLVEFVKQQVTPAAGEEDALPGPTRERLTTFLNLFWQLVNPTYGRYVWLSLREDAILRDFYGKLTALTRSHTFCAMDERSKFPDYPFGDEPSTIFSRWTYHKRLRVDAAGERAYSVGAGLSIHVFDLATEKMIKALDFPPGKGTIVQDVAFSSDGATLYAIALSADGQETYFAAADIGNDYKWGPLTVVCDVQLLTLGTAPTLSKNLIYAASKLAGLYTIDPDDATPSATKTAVTKKTVGHLVVDEPAHRLYLTIQSGTLSDESTYDAVTIVDLDASPLAVVGNEAFLNVSDDLYTGDDDIAVVSESASKVHKLYVVAQLKNSEERTLLVRDETPDPATSTEYFSVADTNLDGGPMRLAYDTGTERLLATRGDAYDVVAWEPANSDAAVADYQHPVQISPVSIAASRQTTSVYVLNYVSNTVTTIPPESLKNPPDREELADYRDAVLDAFAGLLWRLIQYLKDCFCELLLVGCPTCDGSEKVYLGTVDVRNGEVYSICNLSQRRYVKTPMAIFYWLSLVPVIPVVARVVQEVCCLIVPDLAARVVPSKRKSGKMLTMKRTESTVTRVQTAAVRKYLSAAIVQLAVKSQHAETAARYLEGRRIANFRMPSVSGRIDEARRMKTVPPAAGTPERMTTAAAVVAAPAPPAEPQALAQELEDLRARLGALEESQKKALASRDRKLRQLRAEVDRLSGGGAPPTG